MPGELEERDFGPDERSSEAEGWIVRLKEAVREAGGNKAVAQQSGVPLSTLTTYLAGRRPRFDWGFALARTCGVTMNWLLTGEQPKRGVTPDDAPVTHPAQLASRTSNEAPNGYAILPRYNVQASAGEGTLVSSEQVVEFLAFHKDWLRDNIRRSPDKLLLIEARGDSMSPTIRDRDLLIVDTAENGIADGAIHVVRMGEALVVKRLELRIDGSVIVHSDNPRYSPVPVTAADAEGIHVIGQVVWQGGPVRS